MDRGGRVVRPIGVEVFRRFFADVRASAGRGIVLPRFLRRPFRALSRADLQTPRQAGLNGLLVLFGGTAIAGILYGGHATTVLAAVTASSGLGIDNVRMSGQSETSEVDVLNRLDLGSYPSLLTFDVDAARSRVEALPWVAEATIRKLYPDTLDIAISERTPFAIWQRGALVSLIDHDGRLIANSVGDRYAQLPMVVGDGAGPRATEFTDMIAEFPSLQARLKAGVLVAERRWNVVLGNGIEILLPEVQPRAALSQLVELDESKGLLDRDIAAVDLRLADRIVVKLSQRAALAREEMLKERDKLAKKKGAKT
jgi:cell division protein FtsQ